MSYTLPESDKPTYHKVLIRELRVASRRILLISYNSYSYIIIVFSMAGAVAAATKRASPAKTQLLYM